MATHLELERWEGPLSHTERLEHPTLNDLQEWLLRLDGDRADLLLVKVDGAGALIVGGGPERFIVVSFPVDGSSSHVESANPPDGTEKLQIGGQTGVYPRAMILLAPIAFQIAQRFLTTERYDPDLNWVQDCPPEEGHG